VLGLDGACFDVLDPLIAAGELPNLAAWRGEGFAAPLRSTVPAMSFPAWSTFQTGLEPGRHGLFDFTQKVEGSYRIRFTNATDRAGRSLFERVTRAGGTLLALGMPATYPPEKVAGLLVAGFDAPVSTGTEPRSASDPELYRAVAARVGPWMQADLDEQAGAEGWGEAAAAKLVARVERKGRFAVEALRQLRERGTPPDFVCVVFSESDTVAHHFWRDHDPHSPRHDPSACGARRGAVTAVYRALDAACGELREAFGRDALCVVASDHGSGGASRHVVHLGRRLAEAGLLTRSRAGGLDRWAKTARDAALRFLPPAAAEAVFRRSRSAAARVESAARFGGIDWRRTPAFSEEVNTQPGVWINRAGREAEGCVAAADYERIRDEVIAALQEWQLPGGAPVVARAERREEVYAGPFVERAPDIVVELAEDAGYGLSLVPTSWRETHGSSVRRLADDELAGGRGRGMNGTHRRDGVWIAHGQGAARPAEAAHPHLRDVAPTLLAALGVVWESEGAGLDGTDLLREHVAYSEAEQAQVARRLRALGYLE
jgi:predicted AlkP superfamily phosphohydrolase/phosphomutase